jgi:hypothetical protein
MKSALHILFALTLTAGMLSGCDKSAGALEEAEGKLKALTMEYDSVSTMMMDSIVTLNMIIDSLMPDEPEVKMTGGSSGSSSTGTSTGSSSSSKPKIDVIKGSTTTTTEVGTKSDEVKGSKEPSKMDIIKGSKTTTKKAGE